MTTSLQTAAAKCSVPLVIKLLQEENVSINETDVEGHTALDHALMKNQSKSVEILLASGAKFNEVI